MVPRNSRLSIVAGGTPTFFFLFRRRWVGLRLGSLRLALKSASLLTISCVRQPTFPTKACTHLFISTLSRNRITFRIELYHVNVHYSVEQSGSREKASRLPAL